MLNKNCSRCKINKNFDEFHKSVHTKDRLKSICASCNNKSVRDYRIKNAKQVRERALIYRTLNKSKISQQRKIIRDQQKSIVFKHYGNKCSCPGCKETNIIFLSIDHINNDGNEYRKRFRNRGGTSQYSWIIKNNFPTDLQILCFNCNHGKYINGGICPHVELLISADKK